MHTVTADKQKRVRIPDAKPGQVFAYTNNGNNSFTLTKVKAQNKEPFPRGSLKYLCNAARNKELDQIADGTVVGVPADYE